MQIITGVLFWKQPNPNPNLNPQPTRKLLCRSVRNSWWGVCFGADVTSRSGGSSFCYAVITTVAVLRWGQGAQAPQVLPRPPKFLDTVVLLLVELIGSIVNFA